MRRWAGHVRAAADLVAGRGELWLPGALAWTLTVGWIPLVVAVARPPTVADLTFLGARIYTSGAWPWNALAAGVGALLVGLAVLVLVAVAEIVLVGGGRRGLTLSGVARVAGIGLVAAAPAVALMLAAGTAFVVVSAREFNAPGVGDPVVRSLLAIWPFGVAVAVAWLAGSVVHAAAVRTAVIDGARFAGALRGVPATLRAVGPAVAATGVVAVLAHVTSVAVAAVLLHNLWAPIETRLALDGIDAAVAPLLVGFVAIWLCIVLGGGALHAWASTTWTRVLGLHPVGQDRAGARPQGDAHRP